MILLIVEGKIERRILDSLRGLYWGGREDVFVYTHARDIYMLYRAMRDLDVFDCDGGVDTLTVLKGQVKGEEAGRLSELSASDISETYLFFDYDFQNKFGSLEGNNGALAEMLRYFDDETGNGKLYVNYPMVEALIFASRLPKDEYADYAVSRGQCMGDGFKKMARGLPQYEGFSHLLMSENDGEAPEKKASKAAKARENWEALKKITKDKAEHICGEAAPSQSRIFRCQLDKFVNTEECRVSVLSSMPLFLLDYFGG